MGSMARRWRSRYTRTRAVTDGVRITSMGTKRIGICHQRFGQGVDVANETKRSRVTKAARPATQVKSAIATKEPNGARVSKDPKPQKLKKIEIKGFKSIESASVELRDLNVVIGANGAGKSNLIGTFKLLERYADGLLRVHVADDKDYFLHHGSKTTHKITLGLAFEGQKYGFTLKPERETLVPADDLPKPVRDAAIKWVVYHFDDMSDQSPARRIANIDDCRFLRRDAANLPAFLYWMQERKPVPFRMIEEHVRLVAPFFECFVLAPHPLNENKIKLEWRQKGSDAKFNAFSLSDGTLRFICLAALLLQPEPPPLILLDEPELGLHPFAINVLAEMLEAASMHSQVIIATQSVTLLSNFEPNDVIVAEHNGTKTTFKRLDEKELESWLEDYSLGDLFEKNVLGGGP